MRVASKALLEWKIRIKNLRKSTMGLLDGSAVGFIAALLRGLLGLAGLLYGAVMRVRNRLYDWGLLRASALSAPVICVGNVTTGGTGKTPLVVWLCGQLQQRGRRVAVVSRGYKGADGENDEMRLLRENLPGVTLVADSDRVRGGRRAIEEHDADVVVLDDGFQHRRLRRDLDIVLIDATCPFGFGRVLPRGLLREPLVGLRRAGAVVITRADQVEQAVLERLREELKAHCAAGVPVLTAVHRPVALVDRDGGATDCAALNGKRIGAVCGIGNPEAFVESLRRLGGEVVVERYFDDHHDYSEADGQELRRWAEDAAAELVVTTEKDWVKLRTLAAWADMPAWRWLRIETDMAADEREALWTVVETALTNH